MIENKYNVIYADPPWSYENKKTGRALDNTGANMAAEDKYDTMSLDDLCALPVGGPPGAGKACFLT